MLFTIGWETKVSVKSLACLGLTLGGYTLWRHRRRVVGYLAIGPYSTVEDNFILRALQRCLQDTTKKTLKINWHPLDSLSSDAPFRFTDNGHPISGAIRDEARRVITNAIDTQGGTKYEISPAPQSYEGGRAEHQHYSPGDLHTAVQSGPPGSNAFLVGIDTDYYLRNPNDYLGLGLPSIFHTFNPVEVAGVDGECQFRIIDNEVVYEVSGGGTWRHRVWDWCGFGEFLECPVPIMNPFQWLLSLVGIRKVVYQKIHHARPWEVCPHRALVWCIPQFSCWAFSFIGNDLTARALAQVVYRDKMRPGWNSIVRRKRDVLMVSLGRDGDDATAEIKKADYDTLMGLSSAQSVTSRMLGMGYSDARLLALVGQYYSGRPLETSDPHRLGRPVGLKVHWPATMEVDVPEVSYRTYGSPVVSDANMVPQIKRWEALSESIDYRITFNANKKVPGRAYRALASEFLRLVVPDVLVGTGVPYSIEETIERLSKPSQVLAIQQIWETVDMPPRKLIECFLKNEPCMKNGRIISSYADIRYLVNASRFIFKFTDEILKAEHNAHWFMCGKTPPQIADEVCGYVRGVVEPIEGDIVHMDGSVTEWSQRHTSNGPMFRYFSRDFHIELQAVCDPMITCPARAKRFGFHYEAGEGVKSGNAFTSGGNSIINAETQYVAVRRTSPDLKPKEAYGLIGLVASDDSVFERQYQKQWLWAFDQLGMKLKVERYKPEEGIVFLARVFPDPLNTTTSFQDPLRTWRKLHLTARDPNVPIGDAALDRVEGYLETDGLTPVTSHYCAMVWNYYLSPAAAAAGFTGQTEARRKRADRNREKPYYSTFATPDETGGSWPQASEDEALMLSCISHRTGFSEETLRQYIHSLQIDNAWSAPTLNRDEEPCPYQGTLDEDGQPIGRVDPRVFQDGRQRVHDRFRENVTDGVPDAVPGPAGNADPAQPGPGGEQGDAGVRGVRPCVGRQDRPRNEEPVTEAQRRQVPDRRGARRGGHHAARGAGPGRGNPVARGRGVPQTRGRGGNPRPGVRGRA